MPSQPVWSSQGDVYVVWYIYTHTYTHTHTIYTLVCSIQTYHIYLYVLYTKLFYNRSEKSKLTWTRSKGMCGMKARNLETKAHFHFPEKRVPRLIVNPRNIKQYIKSDFKCVCYNHLYCNRYHKSINNMKLSKKSSLQCPLR